ncbi:MAG: HAMP domain-containing histidine kinase [Oscillospiraceae bacterium]|nr:HAMP domain-containing histidine kinase [Oscillospiraceae bacterium]
MTTRELFDKVRDEQQNRFSLRTRLTALVTLEMIVCILIAYGVDLLFNQVIPLGWEVPLELEFLCVCLLVGILVTSQLSKIFFNPIKKLRGAMDKVAEGDFSVRLEDKSSSKEIMEIYTGFNLMAHELSATEILQSDFVSNVSHEFKTPINAIAGYSTLLQGSDNLDDDQREYIDKILFNTQRLSSLVGSVLLLSKLENQQIPTNQAEYRLDEQIRQSVVAQETAWVSKDIGLDLELDRVTYLGNEPMMRHVWDNLISNAIKFSPVGGTVKLKLTKMPKKLIFAIEDQGPGLTEEAQKHIFDKFFQADNSHKQEGNGLGLALVKRILAIEKGEIGVENLPEGGCCFTVTLKTK